MYGRIIKVHKPTDLPCERLGRLYVTDLSRLLVSELVRFCHPFSCHGFYQSEGRQLCTSSDFTKQLGIATARKRNIMNYQSLQNCWQKYINDTDIEIIGKHCNSTLLRKYPGWDIKTQICDKNTNFDSHA